MSHGHDNAFVPRRFVLAQFATTDGLLAAATAMREKGHTGLDTHTPYPVHGIEEALGLGRARIPKIVLLGAVTGACAAYAMMYFMNVIDYPINVANRPPHSAPAFIPITFELTVLLGGISAFLGTLGLARLPQPYHPVFEWDKFTAASGGASIDGFFLSVEVPADGNPRAVADEVRRLDPTDVQIVEESER